MDKAILVIDMPNYCSECILCRENDFCHEMCVAANEHIFTSEKPDWCPLKPVPEKMKGNDSIYYQCGDGDAHCFACNPSDRVYIVSNERYKQLRDDAKKGIGVLSAEDIASAIENTKKYIKGCSDNG